MALTSFFFQGVPLVDDSDIMAQPVEWLHLQLPTGSDNYRRVGSPTGSGPEHRPHQAARDRRARRPYKSAHDDHTKRTAHTRRLSWPLSGVKRRGRKREAGETGDWPGGSDHDDRSREGRINETPRDEVARNLECQVGSADWLTLGRPLRQSQKHKVGVQHYPSRPHRGSSSQQCPPDTHRPLAAESCASSGEDYSGED